MGARETCLIVPSPTETEVRDVTLILLDLNGVLYTYDRDVRINQLALVSKQSPEAIKRAIWDSGYEDSGDAGDLDAAAYLAGFGARIGCDLTEADWLASLGASITPDQATLTLLTRIRPEVQCAVLTNNNLLVRRHFATLYPEVATLVGDRAYVSAEFGARKPDADAYHRCLTPLGEGPATTLFIDDSSANVEGARQAGLQAYRYVGRAALAKELHRHGVLAPKGATRVDRQAEDGPTGAAGR
jgi:glucose-1-phosphatase